MWRSCTKPLGNGLDDGKSNLLEGQAKKGIYTVSVTDDEYDDNFEAAQICPVNIIRIEKY